MQFVQEEKRGDEGESRKARSQRMCLRPHGLLVRAWWKLRAYTGVGLWSRR
jgi:hypothetical protein